MAIAFQEHRTSSDDLTIIQQNIVALADSFCAIGILDGRIITEVVLSSTPVDVAHGLGRPYKGFIVIDSNSNRTVYNSGASPDVGLFISLRIASGANTVSLWVF